MSMVFVSFYTNFVYDLDSHTTCKMKFFKVKLTTPFSNNIYIQYMEINALLY